MIRDHSEGIDHETAKRLTEEAREDVARDDTPAPFDPDAAIERLATTMQAKAQLSNALKTCSDMETDLRGQLEEWFIAAGQVTVKKHGLSLTLERRSDFRVTDVGKACAHLSDLDRLDEVMVTRADSKLIEIIGRKLEGTEAPLEGCERVQSARLKVSVIAAKGDDDAK